MGVLTRSPLTHSRLLNPFMARKPTAGGGGGTIDYSFITGTSTEDNSDAGGGYTYSSVSIGAADAARVLGVGVTLGSFTGTLDDVTVGGISAATILQIASAGRVSAIALVEVPTGTSADIALDASGQFFRSSIDVFRLVGASTTILDPHTDITSPFTKDMNHAAGGAIIGIASGAANGASCTWAGITEINDGPYLGSGDEWHSAAGLAFMSAGTTTITATPTNAAQTAAVFASLQPV